MRKQSGVVFQAPLCPVHGEEMTLSVMHPNRTYVEWFCARAQTSYNDACVVEVPVLEGELPVELEHLLSK